MRPHSISLSTPFDVGRVNAYLFTDDPVTIVDPGPLYPPAQAELTQALERYGVKRRDVRRILVTHHHPDHAGFAPALAAEVGAELCLHPEAAARFAEPLGDVRAAEGLLRRHGVPEAVLATLREQITHILQHVAPLGGYRPLEDGDELSAGQDRLRTYVLPGHAPGHLCFLGPGYLIGGDLLIEGVTPNPVFEVVAGGRRRSMPEYLESLRRASELPPWPILPGHRGEIRDPHALIEQNLKVTAERRERILAALRKGAKGAFALSQELYPMDRGKNPLLALSLVLGQIDLLMQDGMAEALKGGEIVRYRAVG